MVEVLNTAPSLKQQRLEQVRAMVGKGRKASQDIGAEDLQAALQIMAEVRGISLETLARDYLRRGMIGDLARLERAANRPGSRGVPFSEQSDLSE